MVILITTSAVTAADNNTEITTTNNNDNVLSIDNTNNDEILTDGNDGSFAELNKEINGDSSTNIVLDKNYTYSSTDTIKTGIVIYKNNTVIDGQGHTIDAKGQSRMFNVTATTVTLKNINFVNGYGVDGGAVRGYGENLRVINCTFTDNTASSWGGAIFSYPDSYAIYANSTFINNKARYGGALATYYGFRHNVINCTFDSNYASEDGGALGIMGRLATTERPYDDHVNIRGCTFTNNKASEGDAISNILSAYINMTDSIILGDFDNLIYSWGAMFFADNNWWGNTVNDASVKPNITNNVRFTKWLYMDFVPHIETSSATVSINNLYDSATGKTGQYSTSNMASTNVKFEAVNATLEVDNADFDKTGKYELNFALLGDSILTANCHDRIVSKKMKVGGLKELEILINNADDNSVIKLDKDYVYTEGIDNIVGVRISKKSNLVIDGNGHTINGMGKSRVFHILSDSEFITLKNINIVNGYTDDGADGAGAYVLAENTKLINCTFANNVGHGYGEGGALHIYAYNVSIDDCRFINNTHEATSAGAIYWRGYYASLTNTIFEHNTAAIRAGAVLLYDDGSVDNCTFTNNVALTQSDNEGAGALYASNATITNSVFINNTANYGAAIMISSKSYIDRSIFINNTASNGIVVSYAKDSTVINSIFLNNHLKSSGYTMGSYIFGYIHADYNWLGHTFYDYTDNPAMQISNWYGVTKWLFLNATEPILDGNNFKTEFKFLEYDVNTQNVVTYDVDDLPSISLSLSGQNLTLNKNDAFVGEVIDGTRTYFKGNLVAEYENIKYILPFAFMQESRIDVNSTFEVFKGESKYLGLVVYPFSADVMYFLYKNGRVTYKINDTSIIKFNEATDKITGLKVGTATITFYYDGKTVMGEDMYTPSNATVLVTVNKAETHINNVTSLPDGTFVGDNGNIIVRLVDFNEKSVRGTLEYINNNPDVIKIAAGGNTITYRTLGEGLANITVKFEGNDDYLPTSRDLIFEIGKKDPQLRVDPDYIDMKVSNEYYVGIYTYSSENFTYISNNTNVAIMEDNRVIGIGEGIANITIRFGGDSRYRPSEVYLIVNVTSDKTYIDVDQSMELYLTDDTFLRALVRDCNDKFICYPSEYYSNDTRVVEINSTTGEMKAVGVGVANITVNFNGRYEYAPSTANIIVTVSTATNNIHVVSETEIQIGQRFGLNATLDYGKGLFYESTNSSIVTVDSWGYIRGISTGEAKIIITYKGTEKYDPATENVTVRVVKIPTSIIAPKSLAWVIGDNDVLNATLSPANKGVLIFKSKDENIVKIDSDGNITAVGVGTTEIEVSYEGNEKYEACNRTIEVNVYSSHIPTSIEVNESFELHVDDSIDLEAILNPENAGDLTYKSSDESVVTVDNAGKITGVKVGEADITISFEGRNAYLANSTTVHVKVSLIPTSIEANDNITVNKTEGIPFVYIFSHPQAGQIKTSFKDISIAHIEDGKIVGDKIGKTILTLKFEGNNKYASSNKTIEVTVTDVETNIEVSDLIEVNLTENTLINANLNPQVGKLKYLDYDKSIISIDANGKITGLKLGSTSVNVVFSGEGKYRAANKTVTVVVKDVETSVVADDSIDVNVTETASIVAYANPKQAGKLHFNTEDSDIISLDEKGNIKGLKVGTATVVVSLDANGKYRQSNKTITVNVCNVSTDIQVDSDNINLVYGDETCINAILTPNGGKLSYVSNNTYVATVDEKGNVKTVKPGVAVITVSYAGEGKYTPSSKNVTVNVARAPSYIKVNDTMNIEIGVGYTLKLDTDPKNMDLVYNSSDSETVNVDENNFIFAYQKGSAKITVSYAGNEYYLPSNATIMVYVNSRATEIRVDDNITIGYGETMDLGAKLYHSIAQYVMDGKLNYESSDKRIVTVDDDGIITAHNIGKATIKITYDGDKTFEESSAFVNVEVTTRTTHIKVETPTIYLHVDDTYSIKAELEKGPSNYQLTYMTNNPNVLRVNPLTGEITALADGDAIVTVSYAGNDEYYLSFANVSVRVSKIATHVHSESSHDMKVYDEIDLQASVTPNNGQLTYSSSDDSIVAVIDGKAIAKKAGNAIITIRFEGDRKYLPSQKQVIISVAKIPTSINLTDIRLFTGETYRLNNIVIPDGVPTGARYYELLSGDTEVFDVENWNVVAYHEGQDDLYVGFKGNDAYLPSNTTVKVTVVKKVLTPENFNVSVYLREDLGRVIFTARLPQDVDEASGFFVSLNKDIYGEYGNIIDGVATVTVDGLTPGDYNVLMRFTGDDIYSSCTNSTKIHIGKYKLDKNKDVAALYTSRATVKYTVHLTRDTQAMEGKKVLFIFMGKKYYATTNYLGYATLKIKLPATPKAYKIIARYSNAQVVNKITVKSIVVAKNLVVKKSAKSVNIKVSLKKVNKKYLSGKKLTLKFNGKKFTAKTNKKGVAIFKINKKVYSKLKAGKKYKYSVAYLKDVVRKKITIK